MAAASLLTTVVAVPAGTHAPFYPAEGEESVEVAAFRMDAVPVTNGEFLTFVEDRPEWQRGNAPSILADQVYLERWAGPVDLGPVEELAPATEVSWHAARAYCWSQGGELPTVTQWEYAADATATATHGARQDPGTLDRVLAWYGSADKPPGLVGQSEPNLYGLHDLHGLIWEWTEDFNSLLISADTRESGDEEDLRFCGAGALSALDPTDYVSFMRFALRSSLQAPSTTRDLGFRCAY
jgi:formylglycine-generating enzyme